MEVTEMDILKEHILSLTPQIDKEESYQTSEDIDVSVLIDNLYYIVHQSYHTHTSYRSHPHFSSNGNLIFSKLQKRLELNKKIYIRYSEKWKAVSDVEIPTSKYYLTALLFLCDYEQTKDLRQLNSALKLIDRIAILQPEYDIKTLQSITQTYINDILC